MAISTTEEMSASLHRGLSEWWSEETDYIFQRIERWAALARGYNRLRSQRLSRGRLTMHEEQESRWSITSNKIVIEDPNWCPRFHNLRRSHHRKSRSDENCRINCCGGTFNYQSNCNIDNNCLENYRYDHSIYFKTIGDIKSSKRDNSSLKNEKNDDNSSDESIEWGAKSTREIFNYFCYDENGDDDDDECDEFSKENGAVRIRINDCPIKLSSIDDNEDRISKRMPQNAWPIVELDKLSLDVDNDSEDSIEKSRKIDSQDHGTTTSGATNNYDGNNNFNENHGDNSMDKMIEVQISQLTSNKTQRDSSVESTITHSTKNFMAIKRIMGSPKSRRNCRKVRQPTVVGDNNILWPGVLLNYTKNVDNSALSPHHYRAVPVK